MIFAYKVTIADIEKLNIMFLERINFKCKHMVGISGDILECPVQS